MTTPLAQRRRALQALLAADRIGSLEVTQPASCYYLTGFTGDAGALVVSRRGTALITDGSFTEQARTETFGIRIVQQEGSLASSVPGHAMPAGRSRPSSRAVSLLRH